MKTETLFIMLCMLMIQYVASGQSPSMSCVAGKVTDQVSGSVIAQLSVVETKSGIGTITADDGSFSLLLSPGNVDLHFFSETYLLQSVTFSLTSDTTLNVSVAAMEGNIGRKARKAGMKNAAQPEYSALPDASKPAR